MIAGAQGLSDASGPPPYAWPGAAPAPAALAAFLRFFRPAAGAGLALLHQDPDRELAQPLQIPRAAADAVAAQVWRRLPLAGAPRAWAGADAGAGAALGALLDVLEGAAADVGAGGGCRACLQRDLAGLSRSLADAAAAPVWAWLAGLASASTPLCGHAAGSPQAVAWQVGADPAAPPPAAGGAALALTLGGLLACAGAVWALGSGSPAAGGGAPVGAVAAASAPMAEPAAQLLLLSAPGRARVERPGASAGGPRISTDARGSPEVRPPRTSPARPPVAPLVPPPPVAPTEWVARRTDPVTAPPVAQRDHLHRRRDLDGAGQPPQAPTGIRRALGEGGRGGGGRGGGPGGGGGLGYFHLPEGLVNLARQTLGQTVCRVRVADLLCEVRPIDGDVLITARGGRLTAAVARQALNQAIQGCIP